MDGAASRRRSSTMATLRLRTGDQVRARSRPGVDPRTRRSLRPRPAARRRVRASSNHRTAARARGQCIAEHAGRIRFTRGQVSTDQKRSADGDNASPRAALSTTMAVTRSIHKTSDPEILRCTIP